MPTPLSDRASRRFWTASALLLVGWMIVAYGVVPAIIRRAYLGQSIEPLNQIISGQSVHPVEFYLAEFARVAWWVTGGLVAAIVAAYAGLRYRNDLRRALGSFAAASPSLSGRDLLLLGVVAGLLLGIGEILVVMARNAWTSWPSRYSSREIVWMAPLAASAVGATFAALLLVARRRWPALGTVRTVVFLFVTLAMVALTDMAIRGLHGGAALVVSLGLAVRMSAMATRRRDRWIPRLGRLAAVLVLAVAGAGLVHHGRDALVARQALSMAQRPDGPSVLLIVLDTVRAQSMSLYGASRRTTPFLDRLATDSVVFDNAFATSSWTLPSHASLFTGWLPDETGVDFDIPMDRRFPTLAEAMSQAGYLTAGFVANLYFGTEHFGLNRGFSWWRDHPVSLPMLVRNEWYASWIVGRILSMVGYRGELARKDARQVTDEFIDWIDRRSGRPFLAFLNYIDAHAPYGPYAEFRGEFSGPDDRFWIEYDRGMEYSPDQLDQMRRSYDSAIRYLDSELERLFTELDARGIRDDALIVITSDHGEEFGEHDWRIVDHGYSLYTQATRVPLVFRLPGVVPGAVRVATPVSIADIPATVATLTGLGGRAPFPGESLQRFWNPGAGQVDRSAPVSQLTPHPGHQTFHPIFHGPMESVVAGSLHYIRAGVDYEELFDLDVDPDELNNLLADSLGHPRLREMRERLEKARRR